MEVFKQAPKRNFENRTLFHCDNLDVLRGMNSETVDLIATDPPFNKGKDFHATPESLASGAKFQDRWSWEKDVHPTWVDKLADDWPKTYNVIQGSRNSYGDDMGAFLCFMGVRLIEMRRVLKPTGSIYVHCDPTASHYLKELMDAIFGRKNFVNEVIWHYSSGGRPKKHFPRKHDSLLFYSKNNASKTFNVDAVSVPRNKCPLCKTVLTKWNNLKKHVDSDGRIYRTIKSSGKTYKYYDDEPTLPPNVWLEFSHLQQKDPERTGYPTQKPLALYERIIRASSNEGDLVLDPFCGCATTPIAAERLGREWVGVDIWDGAHQVVLDRLQKEGLMAPSGGHGGLLFHKGQIGYLTEPPVRTDGGQPTTPYLEVKTKQFPEEPGPHMTRAEIVAKLLEDFGMICQGCGRSFDDPLYLELDHNTPRSQRGLNHISNRILLCSPCNRIKSNTLTLEGLRRENKKRGRMAKGA